MNIPHSLKTHLICFQVQMERLSFISGSSANEEDDEEEEEDLDDDEEDPMAALLPPPPLPPKPAVLLNQQPRNSGILQNPGSSQVASVPPEHKRELTPMVYSKHHFWMPETSDLEQIGTVRRKAKRDRNRTDIVSNPAAASEVSASVVSSSAIVEKSRGSSTSTLSKSRSKSRSPGRSIEANRRPGPCSLHASRGNSPDNISESSASFHENELIQQHQPPPASAVPTASSAQIQAHFRPQQGSSSSSSSVVPQSAFMYANRDSVRESWISSGSSDHPQVYYRRQQVQPQPPMRPGQVSSGGTSDASNKSISSGGGGGHFQRQKQHPSSGPGGHYAKAPVKVSSMTLPRAANSQQPPTCLRHSQQKLQQHHQHQQHSRSISRESGSSSSRGQSRSGSRSAGLLPQSRSGSSSALAYPSRSRSGTPQGKLIKRRDKHALFYRRRRERNWWVNKMVLWPSASLAKTLLRFIKGLIVAWPNIVVGFSSGYYLSNNVSFPAIFNSFCVTDGVV